MQRTTINLFHADNLVILLGSPEETCFAIEVHHSIEFSLDY